MVSLSRYTKGGISVEYLQNLPFEDYLLMKKAIQTISEEEKKEIDKQSKWKR